MSNYFPFTIKTEETWQIVSFLCMPSWPTTFFLHVQIAFAVLNCFVLELAIADKWMNRPFNGNTRMLYLPTYLSGCMLHVYQLSTARYSSMLAKL